MSDSDRKLSNEETRQVVSPEAPTQSGVPSADESLEERIKRKLSDHDEHSETERQDPLIGTVINQRFKVIERIGEGGMGAVYRAEQIGMSRSIAVKVLLRELTENETVLRRFHLEALAVSKLRHPNTIQIFDFGETEDGLLYIAMELLQGRPLVDVLRKEKQLSVKSALHVIAQVAMSLREAHSKGIVHRDLKPDNIFLETVDGDPHFAKVLDFGVAKVAEGDGKQKTLTQAGAIFGTPKYMSPEQSRGVETDARSDIYSMGVILYELLSGRVPFNAENPLGILIKHIQEVPPTFQAIRPDLVIPETVERFVHKMLAKDPADRPQSSEAVIRELEKLGKELPPLFESVVTRSDVEEAGLEISTMSVTAPDTILTGLETSGNTATSLAVAPIKKNPWPMMALATLLVLLGTSGVIYANLPSLEPNYYQFSSLAAIDNQKLLPTFDVDSVVITLLSSPLGAKVVDQNKQELGETPLTLRRNKGSQPEKFKLTLEGYEEAEKQLEFLADSAVNVTLVEIPKPVEEPQPRPSGGTPVQRPVRSAVSPEVKTETKPPATDRQKPNVDFQRVKDIDKNPYGVKVENKGSSLPDSPY